MYISCHVSWLLFAIACPCRCIIMYFKCLKMLFWIARVIFFKKKEVVAIVNVFMYWRQHSFKHWECCVLFFLFTLFMFSVNLQSTQHIFLTSEDIVLKKNLLLPLSLPPCVVGKENNQLQWEKRGNRTLDVMQLWPRVSQLNEPYLMKTWCATAFDNGCNTTTVCLLVCRRPQKSILLKHTKKIMHS